MNWKELQFLFLPNYWVMNHRYKKEVDEIVNQLLDKYEFTDLDALECTAQLGKITIWVSNRPYGAMRLYGTVLENYRPSRLTIKRALKKFHTYRNSLEAKYNEESIDAIRNLI